MDRDMAVLLIKQHARKENNIKHMIAVGAVMRALAKKLGEDEARWEIIGILHDIDFEECRGLEEHTMIAKDLLSGVIDGDAIQTIMAHNHENTHVALDTPAKKSLVASDAVSGLVVATALVMPSKKLADVRPDSLAKKFRNKDFAKGCDRSRIAVCEGIGISLDDFLALALEGMKQVSGELGL
jgi:predicted hydrolase (HD superfamily)